MIGGGIKLKQAASEAARAEGVPAAAATTAADMAFHCYYY